MPASAATSPPKSPAGRSMPSPSAKRTKPVTLIGAADCTLALFEGLGHALLVVVDEWLIEQADLLVEGLEPRTRRSSRPRWPACPARLCRQARPSRARWSRGSRPDGSMACGLADGHMHRDHAGRSALSSSVLPADSSATITPMRAEPVARPSCARSSPPRPCRPKARRRGAASCSRRPWRWSR